MSMRAKKVVDQEMNSDEQLGEFWREVMASKPRFSCNQDALAAYMTELESIAAGERKSVRDLVIEVDDSNQWTDREKRVHELSMLISSLRRTSHAEKNT